jgi:hypothetical protein
MRREWIVTLERKLEIYKSIYIYWYNPYSILHWYENVADELNMSNDEKDWVYELEQSEYRKDVLHRNIIDMEAVIRDRKLNEILN